MKTDTLQIGTGRRPRIGVRTEVAASHRVALRFVPLEVDLPVQEDRVRH
jgi:hypothetical protein